MIRILMTIYDHSYSFNYQSKVKGKSISYII